MPPLLVLALGRGDGLRSKKSSELSWPKSEANCWIWFQTALTARDVALWFAASTKLRTSWCITCFCPSEKDISHKCLRFASSLTKWSYLNKLVTALECLAPSSFDFLVRFLGRIALTFGSEKLVVIRLGLGRFFDEAGFTLAEMAEDVDMEEELPADVALPGTGFLAPFAKDLQFSCLELVRFCNGAFFLRSACSSLTAAAAAAATCQCAP
mmetsp:Transcript_18342/g.31909  ORF Transcript_18342/g.31909 Transcript_18342/m.31909 type:complete len:211 (-) Transcript_18342:355-987(-)